MKAPHRTEHVFSPREGGHTEEIDVELELQPSPSDSRVEDVGTLTGQGTLRPNEIELISRTQSQPQLTGIWASRAQFPGTPLEPREALLSSGETAKLKRSITAKELTDGQQQTEYAYTGKPLQGAWAKSGISGASVIKSALQIPASPAYSSNSSPISSGRSTPRNTGDRTPDFGIIITPQLKHSVSGPVRPHPQAQSPSSYRHDRRSHSEQFTRRDFQEARHRHTQDTGRNDYYQGSPRGRTQQGGTRGQGRGRGSGRRLSETPTLEGEGPRRTDGEGEGPRRTDGEGWVTQRGGRSSRDRGDRGRGFRASLSPHPEMDYQRSYSDTKAMKQQQNGRRGSQQSSRRPESEPPSRGRGRTGKR